MHESGIHFIFVFLAVDCSTFFKLGFTLRKAEKPLGGMELQEKEVQKD